MRFLLKTIVYCDTAVDSKPRCSATIVFGRGGGDGRRDRRGRAVWMRAAEVLLPAKAEQKGTRAGTGGTSLRRGFTLLEIIIVGVLVSVLMVGVWSLFRSWGNLYERGQQRVESAQLVRSLCDQFADDVRAVAYVAPPPRPMRRRPGSGTSSRSTAGAQRGNLALVGEANWLVLEILQPPTPFVQATSSEESTRSERSRQSDEETVLSAPELQRVMYTFEPPVSDELSSLSPGVAEAARQDDTEAVVDEDSGDQQQADEPFTGLLRLAVAAEQFDSLAAGDVSGSRLGQESVVRALQLRDAVWQLRELVVGPPESDGLSPRTTSSVVDETAEDPSQLPGMIEQDIVPEVIRLEFRYFDGSAWLSSWDSQAQRRLPVAIEMRFELKEPEPLNKKASTSGETELVSDDATDSSESFLPADAGLSSSTRAKTGLVDDQQEPTPYHRCVIYLEPTAEQPPVEGAAEPAGSSTE